MAVPGPIPGAGGSPPDERIGRGATRVENMRRIPSRDVVEVANIVGGVRRHVLVLVSEGRR